MATGGLQASVSIVLKSLSYYEGNFVSMDPTTITLSNVKFNGGNQENLTLELRTLKSIEIRFDESFGDGRPNVGTKICSGTNRRKCTVELEKGEICQDCMDDGREDVVRNKKGSKK